ncbi:MAG: element excision factor XisI family protein [Nostoc sp. DedVER02]|uniref:element excision factor XisI family protein n=1 Tax=Nostoc sp. DedVER02 TaxID=3075405 RepID=UPI0039198CBD
MCLFFSVILHRNGTQENVGEQLAAMGVPKHDIAVRFHPPYIRQYTDYAVS